MFFRCIFGFVVFQRHPIAHAIVKYAKEKNIAYSTVSDFKGLQGKDQFKRAQSEIKELREDVKFLDEKNAELRSEIREIKDAPLSVARDDTPAVKEVEATETPSQQPEVLTKRKDDARHTNHAGRVKHHADQSHGDAIRAQQAEASEREAALGA